MNKLNVFSLTILALLLNSVSQAQITWAFGEYTGNGSASAVTGVGFQADAILIKSEGASQAVIVTSDMTAGDTKPMGSTSAHTTGRITSIDADGFSLGTDAEVNSTGIVYQWMAFEDLTGDDLSVGTYTGTGSSVTISTIGFQPDMIWYWGDGGDIRDDATMYLKSNSEKCDRFRDGYRSTNMIGNLNSSGFTTGGDGTHGRDILGVEYYYIAFDTDGDYFKYGGFTGKSSGSKTITVSWESQFVIVNAAIQNSQPVMRLKSMSGDESLRFHAHAVHTDAITSMTATTFVVGTDQKAHDYNNANDWGALKGGTNQTVTVTLPVELIYFNAQLVGEKVLIEWTTASEIKNDYFSIERSTDGINFEVIEVVNGAGNSMEIIDYSTFDLDPLVGMVFYRIRQTDFDGTNVVCDIKSIFIGADVKLDWIHSKLSGKDQINLYGDLEGTYNVKLFDLTGSIVYKTSYVVATNKKVTSALIDLPQSLSKGAYIINIDNGQYSTSGKIVVRETE